jgi:hypothetical protein
MFAAALFISGLGVLASYSDACAVAVQDDVLLACYDESDTPVDGYPLPYVCSEWRVYVPGKAWGD